MKVSLIWSSIEIRSLDRIPNPGPQTRWTNCRALGSLGVKGAPIQPETAEVQAWLRNISARQTVNVRPKYETVVC
jgi:hypothetical protein